MAINPQERARMLKAHSVGPMTVRYLEEIGIERLSDLVRASAEELAFRIDIALGRKHINKFGIEALANLIALAEAEHRQSREAKMPPEGGI
ncbi:hypothetical protein IB238_20200 [Rhizobium sp. ARZ01]|uniref:hypothetical protein n=1 Tax=Rhizobium sp. ARZ01 TaxID=2769313 RepID=UPI00177DD0ED|nr:hypothetical protein [Rhizobium sp. ARZ01]MBD9374952.1 hypothetical protein [Rhizobium sp. ARZ01]